MPTAAAGLSGALLGLAFPGADLWLLAWVALVPLFLVLEDVSPWQGWWLGLATGFVFRLVTLYWVTGAIIRHGGLSMPLALAVTCALMLLLAAFTGGFGAAAAWLLPGGSGAVVVMAALWVGLEWMQSWFLGGFPWALVGYPAARPLPMMQVADLAGVYGLSFLAVFFNGALAVTLRRRPGSRTVATVATALVALATVYGLVRLAAAPPLPPVGKTSTASVDDIAPSNSGGVGGPARGGRGGAAATEASPPGPDTLLEPIRVAVVQGNVAQDRVPDLAAADRILLDHLRLTRQALDEQARLVVWPESSVPSRRGLARDPVTRRTLAGLAGSSGVPLLVGSPHPVEEDADGVSTNSAFLVTPDGDWSGRYDKVRLVPFGEYVPLRRWLPLGDPLMHPAGGFRPGDPDQPLLEAVSVGVPPFATAICYEIVFPSLVRRQVQRGATFLVTITNDAWLGDSSAPLQHFEMARLRAVEMRRWLVRAANTGISGIVDPWGRIHRRLELGREGVLVATIVPRADISPYALRGDLFVAVCVLLVGVTVWMRLRGGLTGPDRV